MSDELVIRAEDGVVGVACHDWSLFVHPQFHLHQLLNKVRGVKALPLI